MKVDVRRLAEREPGVTFKKAVLQILGDLAGFEMLGQNVLVASYIQPEKTPGGIILTDKTLDEDRWQGKVNLILKMGPTAFAYTDGGYKWEGRKPKVGDYIMFHTSDGRELAINGVSCRLVDAQLVRMIAPDPDAAAHIY